MNLVSINEREELNAQREFYKKIKEELDAKRTKKLNFWKKVSLIYLPVLALGFVAVYWLVGLRNADII